MLPPLHLTLHCPLRTKFYNVEVHPQVISSPPSTGLVLQSYASLASHINHPNKAGAPLTSNKRESTDGKGGAGVSPPSAVNVVSVLHQKPAANPFLERSADELAAIVVKQTDKNIDKFSNASNEFSAVVGFKPFEGSIHTR